jgi:hypothetical protein
MRSRYASVLVLVAVGFATRGARAQTGAPPASAAKPAAPAEAPKPAPAAEPAKPAAAAETTPPAAPPTAAPVDDPAGAKRLFDEAVELARGGDLAAACPKLEQSLALHDGLGTEFHLAGCWSKIGRTASAYALYEKVANKAHELGQTEREDVARQHLEALLPKLSRVRIDVTNAAPKTEVKRDGVLVPESDWGKPIAVDRGPHEVVVTAEGKTPWSSKLDVSEPSVIIAVQVPALADEPKALPPVAAVAAKPEPKEPAPPPPAEENPSNGATRRTIAIVVGGVGVAALAAGIFKGAEYVNKNNQAKDICPSGVNCTGDEIQQHQQAIDDARKARTWAYVGIGVGSAAVVGATVLYVTAPHAKGSQQRATRLRIVPLADGRGSWGGAVYGSF